MPTNDNAILKRGVSRVRQVQTIFLAAVLYIMLWTLISILVRRPFFLPTPAAVLISLKSLFITHRYLSDIGISAYRILIGFALSVIVALPLGVAIGVSNIAEVAVAPAVDFFRYAPITGFIPLAILWFGIGEREKIAVIFLGTVVQLIPLVSDAVAATPPEYVDTARTLGYNKRAIIGRVVIPNALPSIYDGCRAALGIAWTYLLVAEIVAAESGIGHMMIQSQRYLETAQIYAGILTVGVIGLVTDGIVRYARRHLFRWTPAAGA